MSLYNYSIPCSFCGELVGRYHNIKKATCYKCKLKQRNSYPNRHKKRFTSPPGKPKGVGKAIPRPHKAIQ